MSGNSTADKSLEQTFGLIRKGLHFHIPSHLDAFCASTQLVLGSAEAIVQNATTLPYYTKFRSPDVAARVMQLVRGNSSHGVAQALGMAKTANHAHPPRRSCNMCIQADKANLGFAYWRRNHQLPGVLVCQEHGAPLLSLHHDHDSISSTTLLWPDDDWTSLNPHAYHEHPSTNLAALRRLAQLSADMARGPLPEGYSVHKMRNTCMSMLLGRQFVTSDGSLIMHKAMKDYDNHFFNLAITPELSPAIQASVGPLLHILSLSERRTHPLEWMLLIDWLFGDWATFEECYRQSATSPNKYEAK